jgi:hypothetical protein
LVVIVDLDRDLQVAAVTPVPESQLAREQAEPAADRPAVRKLKPGSLVAGLVKKIRGTRSAMREEV